VNVQSLSGPITAFYTASGLDDCDLSLGDYCQEWHSPSTKSGLSECDFQSVPVCNSDCMVLYEWIKISPGNCCSSPGITCDQEERIISMFVDLY
jgi:hypothetical protein